MDNKNKREPIYLDQQGYDKLLMSIKEIKEKININNRGRKAAFEAGSGDGWDTPEFEEIERQERVLLGELQRRYEELSNVIILENQNDNELIGIGDVINICIIFDENENDIEKETVKLVGGMPNFDMKAEIKEISINSPIGKAIYKKKVGEQCSYIVNNKEVIVLINEKINLEKQQSGYAKKLIK